MISKEDLIELSKDLLNMEAEEESYTATDSVISNDDVKTFSSDKLCSLIASNRYLRFSDSLEINAMQELATRRVNGDLFAFEAKISEYFATFAPLTVNMPDLMKIVSNFRMIK